MSKSNAEVTEKKKSGPWFAIIVAVLAAALLFEGVTVVTGKTPVDWVRRRAAIRDEPITYLGRKTAPIKIEFYAPHRLPWHQKTVNLLKEYDKQHPGRIFVTFLPIGNSKADKLMNARGYSCAVTFINGEHEFTLPNGTRVDLQKWPNKGDASSYNSEDVITILENLKVPSQ